MKIAMSGHTGFLGSSLKAFFASMGHHVVGMGRDDFGRGSQHLATIIEGSDILLNLAGAPVIKRWTRKHSKAMWNSRILTTEALVQALGMCREKPKAFFSASAVGIYSADGQHDESSHGYDPGYLGILCQEWETAALKGQLHCPVYIARFGIVLGRDGGALPRMALPFRLGLGGKIGSGKQGISWIHLSDFQGALWHLMQTLPEERLYNLTAPEPVLQVELSRLMAKVMSVPNIFTVPAIALKFLYGEGAITLLSGQKVLPTHLLQSGYSFDFPQLEGALIDLLGKKELILTSQIVG